MSVRIPTLPPTDANYRLLFGVRLKAVRKARGMSQDDVASETGLSRNYISQLERGRRNPTLSVLLRLTVALKLNSIEQILSQLPEWGSETLARTIPPEEDDSP